MRPEQGLTIAILGTLVPVLLLGSCSSDESVRFRGPPAGGTVRTGNKVEKPRTIVLPSGVEITDLVIGTGKEARSGSTAEVHYTGTLDDGKVFDKSDRAGSPRRFVLSTGPGGVISGFAKGIPGMREGGVRNIRVPWQLGYGAAGSGTAVPPKADLRFRIELVSVH